MSKSYFTKGKALSEDLQSKPVIGKRKRPVGRPRKLAPATAAQLAKLVPYSSSEDEESSSECNTTKKKCIHRMYTRGQKNKVAYYARHHGNRKASRHFGIHLQAEVRLC